jgi:MFS family permease
MPAALCTATVPRAASAAPARARLSPRSAFFLQASMTLSFLVGSSAPTPMYALYQLRWGFSPTMLTLAFGIYALAVLGALLVVGRLSDHVGRRPVLIAAAVAQVLAMLVFATATGLNDLLLGRVIQGLSAGAAVAAVGAGLLDIDKLRGAVANAVAPMLGTATGGVLAGLMVQYLPQPTRLVYEVLAAVFVLQGLAIAFIHETSPRVPGAWASLKPRLAVSAPARAPLLLAAPVLVAVWALAGFHASLGPTLLRRLSGSDSIALGGVALFVLAGSGALAVLALQRHPPRAQVRIGTAALVGGLMLATLAISRSSVALFLLGTAVSGAGFGSGFQGALRTVVASIAPHERAGVLSVLFVVSYLAMGVPAMLAGYGLTHGGDIVATARGYGLVVAVLAGLALAGTFRRGR